MSVVSGEYDSTRPGVYLLAAQQIRTISWASAFGSSRASTVISKGITTHSAGWGTVVKRLIRQRDAGLCRSQPKGTNFTKAFLERRDASQDLLGEST